MKPLGEIGGGEPAGGVVMVWRADDERTQRRVQARQDGAGEARVAVRGEHVGSATSRNTDHRTRRSFEPPSQRWLC